MGRIAYLVHDKCKSIFGECLKSGEVKKIKSKNQKEDDFGQCLWSRGLADFGENTSESGGPADSADPIQEGKN